MEPQKLHNAVSLMIKRSLLRNPTADTIGWSPPLIELMINGNSVDLGFWEVVERANLEKKYLNRKRSLDEAF